MPDEPSRAPRVDPRLQRRRACKHARTKADRVIYDDLATWVVMRCVKCGGQAHVLPSRFSQRALDRYYGRHS